MLSPEALNPTDEAILDVLAEQGCGTPQLVQVLLAEQIGEFTRQYITQRMGRLREHGHIQRVRPKVSVYEVVDDPREQDEE